MGRVRPRAPPTRLVINLPENPMSIIYVALLIGVSVAILGALFEAMAAVTRKPHWHKRPQPQVTLVPTVNSRTMDLPYVGADRRGDSRAMPLREERDAA